MARFERSRDRKRESRDSYSNRDDGGRSFEDHSRGRRGPSRGGSNRFSRDRRDVEMTKVICSSCGDECEVPFKPTSDKPLFCRDCFAKKEKPSSNGPSNKDLDIINEKLNKIMKALDIE